MRRFAWFDCLRCVAVLLVILAHCGRCAEAFPAPLAQIFTIVQRISWVGVDLFFVLSGFLVSGLLFDEHDASGTLDFRRFLIRRAFKIVPAFYVLVLITTVYDLCRRGGVHVDQTFHDLFFLQSYRMGAWPHAWTLSVEVHFYLLLALLFFYLYRKERGGRNWLAPLPYVLFGVMVASFIVRLINSAVRQGNFNFHRELQPTHLHLDVLAAGVLLRFVYQYHHPALAFLQRGRFFWLGLAFLLVWPSECLWLPHPVFLTALIPTCNAVGFGLILFEATQLAFPTGGWRQAVVKPFDYLGKHSYSIYLWHLPTKDWLIDPLLKGRGFFYLVVLFGSSLVIGTIFSVALEMPILHLRNRLFPTSRLREPTIPDPGIIVEPAG